MNKTPFPPYIQGESIYSFVAQIHLHSIDTSSRHTNIRLFGVPYIRIHPVLPAHITEIASHISLNPYELLLYGTGFCLHAFALTNSQDKIKLANSMLSSKGRSVFNLSHLATCKLSFGTQLKLCPDCLVEDENDHGIGYWHTNHQLFGVTVCPKHNKRLSIIHSGKALAGRRYLFPDSEFIQTYQPPVTQEIYLSRFIIQLHQYLIQQSPLISAKAQYKKSLQALGMTTRSGNLRLQTLRKELSDFWGEVFEIPNHPIPSKLSDFLFTSKLVHSNLNLHYLKHVLLMAYLAKSPAEFFRKKYTEKIIGQVTPTNVSSSDTDILRLLTSGLSMKKVSALFNRSISYTKQLAKRNGVPVESRSQIITEAIEREVWRKAFIGMHRKNIAEQVGISISSVEQITHCHKGLMKWRTHLRFIRKLRVRRENFLLFINKYPTYEKKQILKSCPAYRWLYKNDRGWLKQFFSGTKLK